MARNVVISIDWDHTLRNLAGLDIHLLSLIFYAKSKNIPVGLTTHRDIENTTLYTLYYWQNEKPDDDTEALAAAINYWDKHLFQPFNVQFDFVNARYQPLYGDANYYQKELLPLEIRLAEDIIDNRILEDQAVVRSKIQEYTSQKEKQLESNEFKEMQIRWLAQQYSNSGEDVVIYHIDDCESVCQFLPENFLKISGDLGVSVETVFYKTCPLFSNNGCDRLFEEIGLSGDLEWLLTCNGSSAPFDDNQLRCLSLCLVLLQYADLGGGVLLRVKQILSDLKSTLIPALIPVYQLVEVLIQGRESSNQVIYLMPNNLRTAKKGFHHESDGVRE